MGLPFKCNCCDTFQCVSLRILLRHVNVVHSQELNFKVRCGINGCPTYFQKYNSFYKHVLKHHKITYDEKEEENRDINTTSLAETLCEEQIREDGQSMLFDDNSDDPRGDDGDRGFSSAGLGDDNDDGYMIEDNSFSDIDEHEMYGVKKIIFLLVFYCINIYTYIYMPNDDNVDHFLEFINQFKIL